MLAKETLLQTSPTLQSFSQQYQSQDVQINTPYHDYQIDYYVTPAAIQGHFTHSNVLKLAKATKINQAKTIIKEIQYNKLIDSKAHKASKKTQRKGDWSNDMVLNHAAIERKIQKRQIVFGLIYRSNLQVS